MPAAAAGAPGIRRARENWVLRIVRAHWLARDRHSGGPIHETDASDAIFLSLGVVRVVLSLPALASAPDPLDGLLYQDAADHLRHRPVGTARRDERGRTARRATLLRFRPFPSAFAGRAAPSEVTVLRTVPLRRFSGLGTHACRRFVLAVLSAKRLFTVSLRFETPPARVIRLRLLSHAYRARARAVFATWPGLLLPATLLGFTCPSQLCSDPRASASFDAS